VVRHELDSAISALFLGLKLLHGCAQLAAI
jgi:hypothetical protein